MSWPLVKLKECCQVVSGGTPKREVEEYWNGDIDWVTPKDLSSLGSIHIDSTPEKITEIGLQKSSAALLPKGSVLFSSRAPIGHIAITTKEMATNQGFKSLVPSTKVDALYLYFCLKHFKPAIEALGNGATFKEVSKKVVENFEIPLPPLAVQKQIAAVLEKADSLRSQCQQMELELNTLAQSVFLDMFGDPATNPKGWPVLPVKKFLKVTTGNTPSKARDEYYSENYIEWAKSDNINTPSDYLTKASVYLSKAGMKVGRTVKSGSILVTCIAGSPSCIGNAAITDREVAFNQQINAVTPIENESLTEFVYMSFVVGKALIQRASTNSMKGMVSKGNFEQIEFPLPPIALQKEYCQIFNKLSRQKAVAANLCKYNDDNFHSLMQRAFKGELQLKNVA